MNQLLVVFCYLNDSVLHRMFLLELLYYLLLNDFAALF